MKHSHTQGGSIEPGFKRSPMAVVRSFASSIWQSLKNGVRTIGHARSARSRIPGASLETRVETMLREVEGVDVVGISTDPVGHPVIVFANRRMLVIRGTHRPPCTRCGNGRVQGEVLEFELLDGQGYVIVEGASNARTSL